MSDPRLARPVWRNGRTNLDAQTIACLEAAERDPQRGHTHPFVVTQGSYQPPGGGAAASAGSHDGSGTVDLEPCPHLGCLIALRRAGLAAWLRTRAQGFDAEHYHCVVVGLPGLAPLAAEQVRQYLTNTGNGLRGSTRDDGPRLNPIPRPVWPPHQEDDMAQYKADLDRIEAKVDKVIKKIEGSRQREIATNALLRKIRKQGRAVAEDLAEIGDLLEGDQ